jgi:hypothetical protein
MSMTRQQLFLSKAASAFGIPYKLNYEIIRPDAESIVVPALISQLGGKMGMLVFHYKERPDLETIKELIRMGYGITSYSVPSATEEFDLESYREMFEDWGWIGPAISSTHG